MPNLYALCASTFLGGSKLSNNGGRCGITATNDWDLVFDDEFKNSQYNHLIDCYCWSNCFCISATNHRSDRPITVGRIVKASVEFDHQKRVLTIEGPGMNWMYRIDKNGQEVVEDRKSTDLEGQASKDGTTRNTFEVCSTTQTCHAAKDCSRTSGCACVVDMDAILRAAGQDAVFPSWTCGWGVIAGAAALGSLQQSGLLGRNVGEVICACNSTYVSTGCCGSADGMIWEDPDGERGYSFPV